jgi:lariat debranching enzyme
MKIGIMGCAHGEVAKLYEVVSHIEASEGMMIDLLLCAGDFQANRNESDLVTMACPEKYRDMCSFYEFYAGTRVAHIPLVFIGGNHEASAHLWELRHGGWVAPNIYYLGHSGVVEFAGVVIAGVSGIFKGFDYPTGYHERPPFDQSSIRSVYHVREVEVAKLLLCENRVKVDICMSHDWPSGVAHHGDKAELLRRKAFLRAEVEDNSLGSPPARLLLDRLRPVYWFSAHMHTKFPAVVPHPAGAATFTKFLALDKCLPHRDFLQVLTVEGTPGAPKRLCYSAFWMAVLKKTVPLTNAATARHFRLPHNFAEARTPTEAEVAEMERTLEGALGAAVVRDPATGKAHYPIPDNFVVTYPPYVPGRGHETARLVLDKENPQTEALFKLLGLPTEGMDVYGRRQAAANFARNVDEIDLGDEGDL